jgi:TP901 family phage tail tape measure protein
VTIGDLIVNLIVGNEAGMKEELSATAEQAGDAAGKSGSKAMAGSFKKGMGVVAGIAAVALGAFAIGSIDAAKNWETAFTGVKKTLDTSGLSAEQTTAAYGELEDGLRDMAKVIPLPVGELASLAEAGGALGIARGDLMDFTKTAAIMGTTTNVAAIDAATALGKIGAVMPFTRDEYSRFAATLVDLGNKGASSESEIVNMAQRMAGAAALIGMSHDELLGWAAAMANVGQEAEAGGSSFQRLALDVNAFVANGGPRLQQVAELAGMTGEAFAALWDQDSNEALRRLTNGLAGLDKNARAAALSSLGFTDIRIRAALLALTANVDNLNTSLEVAPEAWDENTAATEEAAKRFATLDSKAQLASAAFNDLMITVGTHLLPVVTDLVTEVTGLVNGITDWIDANPELVSTLTPVLGVLAGLVGLKFGAKLMASLLPLPGAGGVLARALAGVLTTAGADRVLVGASGTLGTRMGTLIQAGLVAGLTIGLAVAIQQAAKDPLQDAADWLSRTLGGSGDINISELPGGQPGVIDQGNNDANQAGADAIIARRQRERAQAHAEAYFAAWSEAWTRGAAAGRPDPLPLMPGEQYFVDAGIEAGRHWVFGMGIGMGPRPGEAYRINAAWWAQAKQDAADQGALAYRAYAERLVNEGTAFWQAGTGVGKFAPPPAQLIEAVRGAAAVVRTGVMGLFDFLPGEMAAATETAADRFADLGPTLRERSDAVRADVRAVMRAIRLDIVSPFRDIDDALWIQSRLGSRAIQRGLNSSDPQIRADTRARVAFMKQQQDELVDVSRIKSMLASKAMERGLNSQDPEIRAKWRARKQYGLARLREVQEEAGTLGSGTTTAYAEGLDAPSALAAISTGLDTVAGVVRSFFKLSSPAEKGPLSERGGPEGWATDMVQKMARGARAGIPELRSAMRDVAGVAGLPLTRMDIAASLGGSVGVDVGEQTVHMVHEIQITPGSAVALRDAGFDTGGLAAELGEVLREARDTAGRRYTRPTQRGR